MAKNRKDKRGRNLRKNETQRSDGLYMYRYKDISGKIKYVYSKDLSDLRKKEAEIHRDVSDGLLLDENVSLNKFMEHYFSIKEKRLAYSTIYVYRDMYDKNIKMTPLGQKAISNIIKSDILYFYQSLKEKGWKYSSMKKIDDILSPCFQLAFDDNFIRRNPCNGCIKEFYEDDSAKRDALTREQEDNLILFVENDNIYSVYFPLIVFMCEMGLRCGELIGLSWDNVNFEDGTIDIDHQLLYKKRDGKYRLYADSPKSRSGIRKLVMPDRAKEMLEHQRHYQLLNGLESDVVIDGYKDFCFTTKNKNPMMPSSINNVLYNIVRKYNKVETARAEANNAKPCLIPKISSHILRHTTCTRMSEDGVDAKVIMKFLGHASMDMTNHYDHVSEERMRREFRRLGKTK